MGAFTPDGDIAAIHSLDEGLIYVDELPTFFSLRRNERFADRHSGWIVKGLESLPRLDVVRTKAGHLSREFLEGPRLEYRGPDGNHYGWEWRDISWIYLEPAGFFSSHDKLKIQMRSGQTVESSVVRGTVRILDLEEEPRIHYRTWHSSQRRAFETYIG